MAILKLANLPSDSVKGTKYYDIVHDYPWTLTPPKLRKNVPYIRLIEYEQDVSTLWAQIAYWITNLKVDGLDEKNNPYQNLYHALKTDTTFILPYFEVYDHNINQDWQKTKGVQDYSLANTLINIFATVQKFRKVAPGTTVNQPQVWSGVGASSYTINFHLFNTTGEDKIIEKNLLFKQRLAMSTLHDQRSIILSSPPALFEVEIPGIRVSPAAVISQLSVNNIGQMNIMQINGKDQIIPDAWEFIVQITELISESRQIYDAMKKGSLVPVRSITENATPPPEEPNTNLSFLGV